MGENSHHHKGGNLPDENFNQDDRITSCSHGHGFYNYGDYHNRHDRFQLQ